MGFFGSLFCHTYDIRAKVELENGEVYKIHCPLRARFVSEGEIINAIKRKTHQELGSPVKRIIELYDASR
jgi:hypothetical protein